MWSLRALQAECIIYCRPAGHNWLYNWKTMPSRLYPSAIIVTLYYANGRSYIHDTFFMQNRTVIDHPFNAKSVYFQPLPGMWSKSILSLIVGISFKRMKNKVRWCHRFLSKQLLHKDNVLSKVSQNCKHCCVQLTDYDKLALRYHGYQLLGLSTDCVVGRDWWVTHSCLQICYLPFIINWKIE